MLAQCNLCFLALEPNIGAALRGIAEALSKIPSFPALFEQHKLQNTGSLMSGTTPWIGAARARFRQMHLPDVKKSLFIVGTELMRLAKAPKWWHEAAAPVWLQQLWPSPLPDLQTLVEILHWVLGQDELRVGGQISAIPVVSADASEVCLQVSFPSRKVLMAQRAKASKERDAGCGSLWDH